MKHLLFSFLMANVLLISSCCNCDETAESAVNYSLLDLTELRQQKDSVKENPKIKLFQANGTTHLGLDISHYQGKLLENIDERDSIRFLICKATQGNYFIDPDFASNWNEIQSKGMIRGAYHFYECSYDPVEQAKHFVRTISDIEPTDIAPILDIEQGSMAASVSAAQMEKDILLFLETVEIELKRKPILYTDYAFAQQYLSNAKFATYDLWLAEYESAYEPKIPNLWTQKGYKIWQKSSNYSVESRQTDLDIYRGVLIDIVK
jgi:lysozyme